MKTFTQISISLALTLGLGSVALAGDAAKAPATPAKKEAPAADAKKAPEAPKKMEPMKAPQELADMAKMMTGTWKCDGKMMTDPTKPADMMAMKMTMKMKTDLGGWWIVGNMDSPAFKGTMYVSYDPTAKKWFSIMMDSMGGSSTETSMGMKDNKIVWEGEGRSPMPSMPSMKLRDTHDMSDMKTGVKMTGEMSMDGKTWLKGWEATCKK